MWVTRDFLAAWVLVLLMTGVSIGVGAPTGGHSNAVAPTAVPTRPPAELPARLRLNDLTGLLCGDGPESGSASPPQTMSEAAGASRSAVSQQAAERLALEMEDFVGHDLMGFLEQRDGRNPRGALGFLHYGPAAKKTFQDYFGVEPCQSEILEQTTGTLRDRWWNQGDLEGYFKALAPMLDEMAGLPGRSAEVARLKSRIRDFERRAHAVLPTGRLEDGGGPPDGSPTDGGVAPTVTGMNGALTCFDSKFGARLARFRENGGTQLAFYALLEGNHRIAAEQLAPTLQRLDQKCGKGSAAKQNGSLCLLQALGYPHPQRILALYRRYGIAVLGYGETSDFDYIESIFRRYPQLFDPKGGKHGVKAILNPDSPDLMVNAWSSNQLAVNLWGSDYVKWNRGNLEHQLATGAIGARRYEGEKKQISDLLRDRDYILLHETGHSVDTRFLTTEQPTALGKRWNAISWREGSDGQWVHRDRPFTCQGVDPRGVPPRNSFSDGLAQKYGFVTFYAATNPAEDFAETVAHYLTDPKGLKRVSAAKYEFLSELLH